MMIILAVFVANKSSSCVCYSIGSMGVVGVSVGGGGNYVAGGVGGGVSGGVGDGIGWGSGSAGIN